jgi:hypothetical protein
MRKALFFLLAALGSACSEAEEGPGSNVSTIRTRDAFCTEWGVQACNENVVDYCQARSVEACRASQAEYCLSIVPTSYAPDHARECLDGVKRAYADGDLDGDELITVRALGEPCDRLLRGSGVANADCTENADCDGTKGLVCVTKGSDPVGTCQVPEEVQGGYECTEPQQLCEEDFYCNGDNCVAHRKIGASCTLDSECGPEAYCESLAGDPEKICVSRGAVGSGCTTSRECISQICLEISDTESNCVDQVRLSVSEPFCETLR